jgi:hypothetical protein
MKENEVARIVRSEAWFRAVVLGSFAYMLGSNYLLFLVLSTLAIYVSEKLSAWMLDD